MNPRCSHNFIFSYERLCFLNNLNVFQNQLLKQLSVYFQIQIERSSTLYIYTSFLHNSSENKLPSYQIPNKISTNKIISLIQN